MIFFKKLLPALLASALVFLGVFYITSAIQYSSIKIELISSESGRLQIFWRNSSQIFSETRSKSIPIKKSSTFDTYEFEIPIPWLGELRIDPLNKAGEIEIRSITITKALRAHNLAAPTLKAELYPVHQVESLELIGEKLRIIANGNDSQLALRPPRIALVDLAILAGAPASLFLLFFAFKYRCNSKKLSFNIKILPKFKSLTWHRLIICSLLVCFAISILFKLHGSSLGAWYQHYPNLFYEQEAPLFGEARSIRSDEWLVHTPAIISQALQTNPYSMTNPSFGAGRAPILMGLPTNHLSTFFRPQYWGFFLFDQERGFSWFWNYRNFSCLIGVYLLLYLVSRGRYVLSITGSLWFFSSSFVQWWLSSGVPELIGNFSLAFSFLFILLSSQNRLQIILAALGCVLFGASFAMQIYPPFQVPLIWLGVFLLLSLFCSQIFRNKFKSHLCLRISALVSALLFFAVIILGYLVEIRETAEILSRTAYPGSRTLTGGGTAPAKYFSGFSELNISELNFPESFGNISEGSSFFLLWPLLLVLFLYSKSKSFIPSAFPLILFILALSSYILWEWPAWLSKVTLLNMVPPGRAMIAIGLANICLTIIALATFGKQSHPKLLLAACALFVFYWHYSIESNYGEFFNLPEHLIATLTILSVSIPIIFKNRYSFCVLILIISFSTAAWVNPLSSGIQPLLNNKITSLVEKNPNLKSKNWLVFGDFILPELFKAAGVNVLSGTKYVPDIPLWRKMDTNNIYSDIYNRFAHFQFEPQHDNLPVEMRLIQADLANVKIAPCGPELASVGIDVMVIPSAWSSYNLSCLTRLPSEIEGSGLIVYTRRTSSSSF